MARRRLTRAERKALTRSELLKAAEELFVRQGYHGTSLDQVAERAGYTKGAVYSAFNSKADLFLAVFDVIVDRRLEGLRAVFAKHKSLESQVSAFAQEPPRPETGRWFTLAIEFWSHAAHDPELRSEFARHWRRLREGLRELIAWQRWGGEDGLTPDRGAMAIMALAFGVSVERLIDAEAVPGDLMAWGLGLMTQTCEAANGDGRGAARNEATLGEE